MGQEETSQWVDLRYSISSSAVARSDHISTRQYARLVDEWVTGIELRREDYGTHSLRRTKSSIIYKQTGNLRAVQILLGHAKIESTFAISGSTSRMHSPSLRYRGLAIS
jgi:integrase